MSTDTDDNDTQEHRCECGRTFENERALTSHQSQGDCETSELVGVAAASENDHGETDPDSPEAVWGDVDPVEAGTASTEFEEKTLSNGKPVVAKDLTEGDIERYRDRVESRHRDLSDEEIGQRAIMIALVEHYDTPSFSGLTFEKYKQGRLGYYNKFLEAIAPEIAARRRGN